MPNSTTPRPVVPLAFKQSPFLPLAQGPPSPSLKNANGGLPYPVTASRSSSPRPPTSTDCATSPPSRSFFKAPSKRDYLVALFTVLILMLFVQMDFSLSFTDTDGKETSVQLGLGLGHKWMPEGFASLHGHGEGHSELKETEVLVHAPGWTVFSNLYQVNSTYVIVTSDPSKFPSSRMMISTGAEIWNDHENIQSREPTEKDIRIITPAQAEHVLPTVYSAEGYPLGPLRHAGSSWIINDPPQFISHYYHFAAECLYGLWRSYSSLLPESITAYGDAKKLGMPKRVIFSRTGSHEWQDYSGMNDLIMRAVLPQANLEFKEDFETERAFPGRALVYDRVLLADRAAAHRGDHFAATQRSASEAFTLPSSPHWWSPVRKALLNYIGGVPDSDLVPGQRARPVITYVSRQSWGRRMLKPEDHERLVDVLTKASEAEDWEFNVVEMDKLSNAEQIRLASKTTVMMGVHGNGLTHLLWMKPEPRSAVMEFFYPGGFAYDYEFTARGLGIQHYGFWGSQTFTNPDLPPNRYPEGFQGNSIPIDADAVLRLVRMKLNNEEESDDG